MKSLIVFLTLFLSTFAWGFGNNPGKIKLKDVEVLTLYDNKMTTGLRSSPVPQLTCVGGSAAGKFRPQVVQCYNRGFDGMDVQWECKTDMDNKFRFGKIEVICEGYDYPDDPYILKGSCGLEYTLDYTLEGEQNRHHQHNYYQEQDTNSYHQSSYYNNKNSKKSSSSTDFADVIILLVVLIIMYAIYATCIRGNDEMGDRQYSSTNGDQPYPPPPPRNDSNIGGGGWFNNENQRNYYDYDGGCNNTRRRQPGTGNAFGGFWGGFGAGSLLGYMFGNRNNGYNRYNGYNRGGYSSTWGGSGTRTQGFSTGSTSSSFSSSSGTRTASGFGGTRRR